MKYLERYMRNSKQKKLRMNQLDGDILEKQVDISENGLISVNRRLISPALLYAMHPGCRN